MESLENKIQDYLNDINESTTYSIYDIDNVIDITFEHGIESFDYACKYMDRKINSDLLADLRDHFIDILRMK